MASIFKRTRKKNEPYTIQYSDHRGKRCTVQGFTDKGLSEQLAAKLESEARLRRTGLVDAEQESYLAQKLAPIGPHVEAFEESLADNSPKHISLTMTRVRRIIDDGKFECLADLSVESVQVCLRMIWAIAPTTITCRRSMHSATGAFRPSGCWPIHCWAWSG